jgi:hypothetical protein
MENKNFFWGGPTHKIQKRLRLDKEQEPYFLRKYLFYLTLTWIPLLVLNIIKSSALNPELQVAFLADYVVWARFFIALPVLFVSERIIKLQVNNSLLHFVNSGIIAENNISEYESLLDKFDKIRDSKTAELIILIISYIIVLLIWKVNDEIKFTSTWIFSDNKEISPAGYWYYFVSAPVFQFFLYRFIWKFLLWAAFLYKISKMKLNLLPTNPDLSAGLRFIGIVQVLFGLIGLAQSSVTSAQIAEWIIITNSPLSDFYVTIAVNILIAAFLLLSPILLFITKLSKVKFKGIMDYGVVANKYVNSFDDRWVKGVNPGNEQLLGTGDIQSLADLFNSYQIVEKMRTIPIEMKQIIYVIIIVSLPFLPLITFEIPLKDILEALVNFFL